MINREICVGCPKRTEARFGVLRNFAARMVLGKEYKAESCEEGPFIRTTSRNVHTQDGEVLGYSNLRIKEGCGAEMNNIGIVDVYFAGQSEVMAVRGGEVVKHTIDDVPVTIQPHVLGEHIL